MSNEQKPNNFNLPDKLDSSEPREQLKHKDSNPQLKELYHEIKLGRISDNPEDYNVGLRRLKKNVKLSAILEITFSQANAKVPPATFERVLLNINLRGLDEDLKNATEHLNIKFWWVENGILKFSQTEDKSDVLYQINILPWQDIETCVEIAETGR
ncbi:hypothetical protein GF340_03035, partial [Candidatus Peregrinibacteria bacterium]|nr:hypothetical protein [Candidatus Peregrinibacteria bacterium]